MEILSIQQVLYNGSIFYSNQNRALSAVSVLRFSSGLLPSNFLWPLNFKYFVLLYLLDKYPHESHEYLYNVSVARALWASHGCYKEFLKTVWYLFPCWQLEGSWFCFGIRDGKTVLVCQAHLLQHKPLKHTSGYPIWNSWFEGGDQIKITICQQLEEGETNRQKNHRLATSIQISCNYPRFSSPKYFRICFQILVSLQVCLL